MVKFEVEFAMSLFIASLAFNANLKNFDDAKIGVQRPAVTKHLKNIFETN
jgi:hypothetical protein